MANTLSVKDFQSFQQLSSHLWSFRLRCFGVVRHIFGQITGWDILHREKNFVFGFVPAVEFNEQVFILVIISNAGNRADKATEDLHQPR